MELRGARCTVRPWRDGDAAAMARHANNVNVAKHLRDRFPHPYTIEDAHAFIRHMRTPDARNTNFAIEVAGGAAGAIGVTLGTDIERFSAEIGYWIGEDFWGRGVATEALGMTTDSMFDRLNLLRLFALPFAENAASIRVLEKSGYVRDGVLRRSAVKNGEPRDQVLFSRINERWRGVSG